METLSFRPVVEDMPKEIYVGVGGGSQLGLEEAVGGKLHTSLKLDGYCLVGRHF